MISLVYIANKSWCEANKAEAGGSAQGHREPRRSVPTAPGRSAPARQPATRTVLVRNFNYWGKVDGNVDEVIFTPIGNDATRVAALLSARST